MSTASFSSTGADALQSGPHEDLRSACEAKDRAKIFNAVKALGNAAPTIKGGDDLACLTGEYEATQPSLRGLPSDLRLLVLAAYLNLAMSSTGCKDIVKGPLVKVLSDLEAEPVAEVTIFGQQVRTHHGKWSLKGSYLGSHHIKHLTKANFKKFLCHVTFDTYRVVAVLLDNGDAELDELERLIQDLAIDVEIPDNVIEQVECIKCLYLPKTFSPKKAKKLETLFILWFGQKSGTGTGTLISSSMEVQVAFVTSVFPETANPTGPDGTCDPWLEEAARRGTLKDFTLLSQNLPELCKKLPYIKPAIVLHISHTTISLKRLHELSDLLKAHPDFLEDPRVKELFWASVREAPQEWCRDYDFKILCRLSEPLSCHLAESAQKHRADSAVKKSYILFFDLFAQHSSSILILLRGGLMRCKEENRPGDYLTKWRAIPTCQALTPGFHVAASLLRKEFLGFTSSDLLRQRSVSEWSDFISVLPPDDEMVSPSDYDQRGTTPVFDCINEWLEIAAPDVNKRVLLSAINDTLKKLTNCSKDSSHTISYYMLLSFFFWLRLQRWDGFVDGASIQVEFGVLHRYLATSPSVANVKCSVVMMAASKLSNLHRRLCNPSSTGALTLNNRGETEKEFDYFCGLVAETYQDTFLAQDRERASRVLLGSIKDVLCTGANTLTQMTHIVHAEAEEVCPILLQHHEALEAIRRDELDVQLFPCFQLGLEQILCQHTMALEELCETEELSLMSIAYAEVDATLQAEARATKIFQRQVWQVVDPTGQSTRLDWKLCEQERRHQRQLEEQAQYHAMLEQKLAEQEVRHLQHLTRLIERLAVLEATSTTPRRPENTLPPDFVENFVILTLEETTTTTTTTKKASVNKESGSPSTTTGDTVASWPKPGTPVTTDGDPNASLEMKQTEAAERVSHVSSHQQTCRVEYEI